MRTLREKLIQVNLGTQGAQFISLDVRNVQGKTSLVDQQLFELPLAMLREMADVCSQKEPGRDLSEIQRVGEFCYVLMPNRVRIVKRGTAKEAAVTLPFLQELGRQSLLKGEPELES